MIRYLAALLCFLAFPALAQPNIVLILVDDFSMNLMPDRAGQGPGYMPNLAAMQAEGMTLSNYIVADSLCCTSRASIFTGLLPHNTGVRSNGGADGGLAAFTANANEAKSFAVMMQGRGYKTAFMGKYLNGYDATTTPIPPGWNKWVATDAGYSGFGYTLRNDTVISTPPEHFTDTISNLGKPWINLNRQPFFIELAPFSPHGPYTPPARYASAFPASVMPKTPAYDVLADPADPAWLQVIPEMRAALKAKMEVNYRMRLQSSQGVDDMIGAIRAKLVSTGMAGNTYVIFTSDNGLHMGEFSLRPGKQSPFDFDVNVPFVIVGPGIAPGNTSAALAQNIDIWPTLAEWAGAAPSATVDGRSMVPVFAGGGNGRTMAVIEHRGAVLDPADPDYAEPKAGDPPTYTALRGAGWLYVEYADGTTGYYTDLHQLNNVAAGLTPARAAELRAAVAANAGCSGAGCRAVQELP